MKPKRVLIIDDHRDSAVMLATVIRLRNPELNVDLAYDGESGLALALAERHDAAIVDLNLPGIHGSAVAMEIRERWESAPPILIALSGNVAEIADLQGSGVFEHALTKPTNLDHLMRILSRGD